MNIKTIVLHHTATHGLGDGEFEWEAIKEACQKKRRAIYPHYVCDYHYGVGPTGIIFNGQPPTTNSWHCGIDAINVESLAVACIGNFEENPMTEQQYKGLLGLIQKIRNMYPLAVIRGHNEIVATACPGRFYPFRRLLDECKYKTQFSDVPPYYPFYTAIREVVAKGIMHGDSPREGTFRPSDPVTRGELAQVIYNWGKKE
jgi:hypothetical protein